MKDIVKICVGYFGIGVSLITGVAVGANLAKVIDKKFDEKLAEKNDSNEKEDWA